MKTENIILDKTFDFSLKIIELYKTLIFEKKEFVMSKQLLRSATSIGANAVEADSAQSRKDFIAKMSISFKEANETKYWIKLLIRSGFIERNDILESCDEIIRILTSILNSARKNLEKKQGKNNV
ncbi:MAG: four helix bundle protein [Candidatus Izemoplasmatales bacterium]|nr:four helix bundle protein [Candidatus Izemoplasmatales bacterium]